MRLINTTTGAFEEFIGRNVPPYAILSHVWEEEEVSFQDMSNQSYKSKKGYRKIEKTCKLAAQRDINHVWVDTCCIDKSSSAELTEAINSMYRWYQRSQICFVYLSDLTAPALLDTALQGCRWFTRGWTLQELIAPVDVDFYDQDWNKRGSKRDLVGSLSQITGINIAILCHVLPLSSITVAQRMSWAANRITTRTEDMAYCLLGIFDINMPLLYGEEEKAFRRLQEEIIKSSADLSIFAWTYPPILRYSRSSKSPGFSGFLAKSPSAFHEGNWLEERLSLDWRELSISNGSIKTRVKILSEPIPGKRGSRYLLPLDCSRKPNQLLAVRLRKCGPNQFIREDPWTLVECPKDLWATVRMERYLLFELPLSLQPTDSIFSDISLLISRTRSHVLQIQLPDELLIHDTGIWGPCWDAQDQLFFGSRDPTFDSGAIILLTSFIFTCGQREIEVDFECMLYAVGWSSLDASHLQCTVMIYKAHSTALKELESRIEAWDINRSHVISQLVYYKIPKTSSAVFKIPETTASAVVTFIPKVVSDSSICQNRFWRLEFFCEVYEDKDLPEVQHSEWHE